MGNRLTGKVQGSVLALSSLRRRIPISTWLQAVGRLLIRPGPPRFGRHNNRDRVAACGQFADQTVLWTDARLPRPGERLARQARAAQQLRPERKTAPRWNGFDIFAARRFRSPPTIAGPADGTRNQPALVHRRTSI